MLEHKDNLSQWRRQVAFRMSLFMILGLLAVSAALGQADSTATTDPLAVTSVEGSPDAPPAPVAPAPVALVPVYTDYKGVTIGMSADDVRKKLDNLKEKGASQDLFVFSDNEIASVYYNEQGKVRAISVDFLGAKAGAPTAELVLGEAAVAKPDGSEYGIKRYPAAGYEVMFSRTVGTDPLTTVTMQKL